MKRPSSPISLIAPLMPSAPIVVDAGAADGADSIRYAEAWPRAIVHAFEPFPANLDALRRRALAEPAAGDRIVVHPVALGAERAEAATFYPSVQGAGKPWPWSGSLMAPGEHRAAYPWVSFGEPITVPVVRLDDEIGAADFLHIDVQGAEIALLQGARRVLEGVRAIWIEVAISPLYEGQPARVEVAAFLEAAGFVIRAQYTDDVDGDELWIRR